MLIFDLHKIGNNLLLIRKSLGLTQAEVAESAGLSDRTYADIERGTVSMKIDTLLKICSVLHITPDEVMTTDDCFATTQQEELFARLTNCNSRDRETALRLLSVFLQSLGKS